MELDAAIKEVTKSSEFKAFQKQHPKAQLAHAFSMHAGDDFQWQLGYYLPSKELVVFQTAPVTQLPTDKPFNKGEPIKPLQLENVKIKAKAAQEKALNLLKEKYPAEQVTKSIVILQQLDKQVYNFTLITRALNICNVRVDAATGEIVSSEMRSIMSLRREEPEKKSSR